MLIGYPPANLTASVDGATATNLEALLDGRPSSVARLIGSGSSVRLRLNWQNAVPIRVFALLGLTCPVGTALKLTGRRLGDSGYAYALGGNAASQKVVELADGSRAAWFVLPVTNTSLIGVQIEVSVAAVDVGELIAHQALDLPIEPGWETERIDPSRVERTLGGGINTVQRRTYRRLRFTPQADHLTAVRQGGLANAMDWERLALACSGAGRVSAIPRWGRETALDVAELHRTALFGKAFSGAIGHAAGNYYRSGAWSIEEVPPL